MGGGGGAGWGRHWLAGNARVYLQFGAFLIRICADAAVACAACTKPFLVMNIAIFLCIPHKDLSKDILDKGYIQYSCFNLTNWKKYKN